MDWQFYVLADSDGYHADWMTGFHLKYRIPGQFTFRRIILPKSMRISDIFVN